VKFDAKQIDRTYPWTGRLSELADEIAAKLMRGMGAEAVWLFGSAARGEPTDDSDIDLLVVVPESSMPRYQRAREAHAIVSDIRVPKDIVVLTREEWERESRVVSSLPSTVQREGKLLYG